MYTYKAKIIEVYDGDTCTAEIDLGFSHSFLNKIRLHGIDTPELRGDQKKQGRIVRDIVRDKILGKEVTIKTIKDGTGKFGRYLAVIFLQDGTNLNDWLIDNGHAKKYLI